MNFSTDTQDTRSTEDFDLIAAFDNARTPEDFDRAQAMAKARARGRRPGVMRQASEQLRRLAHRSGADDRPAGSREDRRAGGLPRLGSARR